MAVTINGTTGIAVPLGTAAAPGVVNTTSATTGIYNPTSTTLGLSTNGTNAVYIDASQNVGIGTSSLISSNRLSVVGGGIQLSPGTSAEAGVRLNYASSTLNFAGINNNNNAYNAMSFSTGASEAMTIDTSGNLLVGTTTSLGGRLSVLTTSGSSTTVFKNGAGGGFVNEQYASSNAGAYYFTVFNRYSDNAQQGYISSNGTTTTYSTTSDVRLKKNIVDAPSALPTLAALQVRSFDWKSGPHQKFGFIAQELVEVDPSAVVKGPSEDIMWGVDTSVLVPMLIKAIQELSAEVEALKAKVGA